MLNHESNQAKLTREAFLDDVAFRLRRRLSPLDVYDSIEEMRSHIDAISAAYQELGLPANEAMDAAVAKFGSAEKIGKSIAGSSKPVISFAKLAPIAITMSTTAVVGGVLMVLIDYFLVTFNDFWPAFGLDLAVGGTFGAVVALIGFFVKWKPATFGAALMVGIDLLLCFTLLQTYSALGKGSMNLQILMLMSPSVFVIGFASVQVRRMLQQRLLGQAAPEIQKALG
jgi:hypothetical protein